MHIGGRAKMLALYQLTSTWNATLTDSPQPHPEYLLTIFYARVEISSRDITKIHLFKYTENFTTKNENFQIKKSDIFLISAQNIDYG